MNGEPNKCPNCSGGVNFKELEMKHHKLGRYSICPKCGKKIIFTTKSSGFIMEEDGFKSTKVKGLSKKQRSKAKRIQKLAKKILDKK